jgi:hypothetical protein
LANFENKQHHVFNTYHQTQKNPKPVASTSTIIRKPVVKNKKRSYAQLHLEFGQSNFLLRACSTCGVQFAPGNVEDEKYHSQFHKRYTQGIQFRVTYPIPIFNIWFICPFLLIPIIDSWFSFSAGLDEWKGYFFSRGWSNYFGVGDRSIFSQKQG